MTLNIKQLKIFLSKNHIRLIRRQNMPQYQSGFTLLELLIVLVIIGLLVGLVGPRMLDRLDQGKVTTAQTQIRSLRTALDTMRLDIGRYPSTEEGLSLLVKEPAQKGQWRGPYLEGKVLPLDPWNKAYQYQLQTGQEEPFALYSFGADGEAGGKSIDADVGILPANR
jgi:general secretion pathway protein G